MKKFIVTFFVVIGVLVTLFITSVVIIAIKQQGKAPRLPSDMVLSLTIDNALHDTEQPASLLNPFAQTPLTVPQIVRTLDRAAQDNRVKALTVSLKSGSYGLAQIQEIRSAVLRFRKTGKKTLVFSDTLGDGPAMGSYYLATAFEQIWLQPIGELAITGIQMSVPFGRDVLNTVGVEPQILHRGRYKSYPESLMRNSMSDDNRTMSTDLINNLYNQITHTITASRNISKSQLEQLINKAPISADEALISGLIDSIGYQDDVDFYMEQSTHGAETVDMDDYAEYALHSQPNTKDKPAYIGYVTIEGTLMDVDAEDGMLGSGVASATEAADAIEEASTHRQIRGLIIRVNSPGGSPIAAEIIRRAIVNATERMPVVISMGDAAASGGYWLSAAADKIVAQPATLTGSIGVFGGKMSLEKLWKKIGLHWDNVTIGRQAGIWSTNTPYSPSEQAAIEASLGRIYDAFIERVAHGRHMSDKAVRAIAEGRVWTGEQAAKNGLVDELGGVDKAQIVMRDLLKLKAPHETRLVPFPANENPVAQFFKMARRLGGSSTHTASTNTLQTLMPLSAATGLSVGDLAPFVWPQTMSTYSFVRVR